MHPRTLLHPIMNLRYPLEKKHVPRKGTVFNRKFHLPAIRGYVRCRESSSKDYWLLAGAYGRERCGVLTEGNDVERPGLSKVPNHNRKRFGATFRFRSALFHVLFLLPSIFRCELLVSGRVPVFIFSSLFSGKGFHVTQLLLPVSKNSTSKVIVYFFLQIHHVGISHISWCIPSLFGTSGTQGVSD